MCALVRVSAHNEGMDELLQAAMFSVTSCQSIPLKHLERICRLVQAVIDAIPHLPCEQLSTGQRDIVYNTSPACCIRSVIANVATSQLQLSLFTFLWSLKSLLEAIKTTLAQDFLPIFIIL